MSLTGQHNCRCTQQRPAEAENSRFSRIRDVASLIRDLGVIVGIPVIIGVGLKLYDIQRQSFDAQVQADAATIKSLEAQNTVLKETQYDRALSLIKSQTEVYSIERQALLKQISDLKIDETKRLAYSAQVIQIQQQNAEANNKWMVDLAGALEKVTKGNYHVEFEKMKLPEFQKIPPPPK